MNFIPSWVKKIQNGKSNWREVAVFRWLMLMNFDLWNLSSTLLSLPLWLVSIIAFSPCKLMCLPRNSHLCSDVTRQDYTEDVKNKKQSTGNFVKWFFLGKVFCYHSIHLSSHQRTFKYILHKDTRGAVCLYNSKYSTTGCVGSTAKKNTNHSMLNQL